MARHGLYLCGIVILFSSSAAAGSPLKNASRCASASVRPGSSMTTPLTCLEQGPFGFEAIFCVGEGFGADLLDACFDFFEVIAGLSLEGWEFGMVVPGNVDQHLFGDKGAEVEIAGDGNDLEVRLLYHVEVPDFTRILRDCVVPIADHHFEDLQVRHELEVEIRICQLSDFFLVEGAPSEPFGNDFDIIENHGIARHRPVGFSRAVCIAGVGIFNARAAHLRGEKFQSLHQL